jgi:ATP-dependent Clp protease ATP-binding subunit ClpC
VGSEHLLLGLIREEPSWASTLLKSFGVNIENALKEVEKVLGRGNHTTTGDLPFTPQVKCIFERCLIECVEHGHHIGKYIFRESGRGE